MKNNNLTQIDLITESNTNNQITKTKKKLTKIKN